MAQLDLLNYVDRIFKDVKLDRILLIASQHILGAQKMMFESLIGKGLSPSNIYLIGKCYSTNRTVMKEISQLGIYVSDKSISFDSKRSFDNQFEEYTKEFLMFVKNRVNISDYEKVIILEDGGNLLSQAKEIFGDVSKFVGVEQTSAGYEKIKDLGLKFPVINVARSRTKLELESPIIADICVKKLLAQLSLLKMNPKNVLIIGAGAVGNAIYAKIKDKFDVKKYDVAPDNTDYAGKNLDSLISDFDMLIGCTGKEVLSESHHGSLKKNCILVSASSSDREFSSANLRKDATNIKSCHDNVISNDIVLLNCGFPINFDGGLNSARPEEIQITLALLFASVCLAQTRKLPKGLIDVDKNIQKGLANEFKKKTITKQ